MNRSQIDLKVKEIVTEQLGVDADEVTDTASFNLDLGADSLDNVELVMALEEEFGIEIDDDTAEAVTTVKQATDLVERCLAAKAAKKKR